MVSQVEILKIYRENFPHKTFNEIAQHTGINASRIFRLFNGHEMKVSEYQKFIKILGRKLSLDYTYLECRHQLPQHQLERLSSILERHLSAYLVTHSKPKKSHVSWPEAL